MFPPAGAEFLVPSHEPAAEPTPAPQGALTLDEIKALIAERELPLHLVAKVLSPEEQALYKQAVDESARENVLPGLAIASMLPQAPAIAGGIVGAGKKVAEKAVPTMARGGRYVGMAAGSAVGRPVAGYGIGRAVEDWARKLTRSKAAAQKAASAPKPVTRVSGPFAERASTVDDVMENVTQGGVKLPPRNVSTASTVDDVREQVNRGVQNDFRGRVSIDRTPRTPPSQDPEEVAEQVQRGVKSGGPKSISGGSPDPSKPYGPGNPPPMPVGAKADYDAWVQAVDATVPERNMEELLKALQASLKKQAKKPGKKPTLRKPK